MRIDFESSGGYANLPLTLHLDTEMLPSEQADEIAQLVESSGILDMEQSDITAPPGGGPPDVMSYQVAVSAGGGQKTLAFNDVTAPAALRPLLTRLRKLAVDEKLKGS